MATSGLHPAHHYGSGDPSSGGFMSSRRVRLAPICLLILMCLLCCSQAFAASVSLAEVLSSRAGRLIFGELIEGSLAAKSILGVHVPDPTSRMLRLAKTLELTRGTPATLELEARLNRIYEYVAQQNPMQADHLFRVVKPGTSPSNLITEADQRLLRTLVSRELDRAFLEQLSTANYRQLSKTFVEEAEIRTKMSPEERALVYWETSKNAAAHRSADRVAIEHYEIPIELVQTDIASRTAPELREALIFRKEDGHTYVRWLINPEDTEHFKAVEKYLLENGVEPVRHKHFEAYQTASRSYIIVDPSNGRRITFSAKGSTNVTGGHWTDKKQPFGDATEARRAVDFVQTQNKASPFRNIIVMDEPVMVGIPSIDQAVLVRVLGELPAGEVTYLPGFSALHGDLGVRIAAANGSFNPAVFWNDHYNKPLARALAELAARTGLTFDSPHSQNFLIEMVGVVPTGRIVLRDFGDSYVLSDFFSAAERRDFVRLWPEDNVTNGSLHVSIGTLHGNEMPPWINAQTYRKWGREFYQVFESEFAAQTGIAEWELRKAEFTQKGRYFNKSYSTRTPGWRKFLKGLKVKVQR